VVKEFLLFSSFNNPFLNPPGIIFKNGLFLFEEKKNQTGNRIYFSESILVESKTTGEKAFIMGNSKRLRN